MSANLTDRVTVLGLREYALTHRADPCPIIVVPKINGSCVVSILEPKKGFLGVAHATTHEGLEGSFLAETLLDPMLSYGGTDFSLYFFDSPLEQSTNLERLSLFNSFTSCIQKKTFHNASRVSIMSPVMLDSGLSERSATYLPNDFYADVSEGVIALLDLGDEELFSHTLATYVDNLWFEKFRELHASSLDGKLLPYNVTYMSSLFAE